MSRASASPARRKSVGLFDRDMNRFDNNNLTLPVTKGGRKPKRGVSMGGSVDMLSETQLMRRQAKPRKSILKSAPGNMDEWDAQTFDYGATIDFGQLHHAPAAPAPGMNVNSRMSLGPRRRVSFAPNTHVRMFDQPEKKPRRKSSMLPRQFGSGSNGSSQSPSRPRISISGASSTRSSLSGPGSRTSSPRARFLGEGEEMSEASMDIESDQSYSSADDSDDILAQVQAIRPKSPVPPPAPDSSSDGIDAEGEMDMDETIIGGGIVAQRWARDASVSDSDSESDMSVGGAADGTDDEMTMDFTVALGGPMPRVPPQNALRGRASIGYSVPSAPGQQPFHPGDAVSDGESMEIEETVAYGYVNNDESTSSSDNSNLHRMGDHTATYNLDFTSVGGGIYEESAMDISMTTVHGGILSNGMNMSFTGAHGGINNSALDLTTTRAHGWTENDTSALDFTSAGGGIAYKSTSVYGAATTMMTNIFASPQKPNPSPIPDPPAKKATSVNIFAPTPGSSSITRPRSSIKPALTPFAPLSAPPIAPSPEIDPELEEEGPIVPPPRVRGGSATPARPAPGTPSRKSRVVPVGTPSFARQTSSSAQKLREAPPSTQKRAPASAQKQKRNVFGASPEPEGESLPSLSRSKSRTPSQTAASHGTAASVAKRLDFSSAVVPSTPTSASSAAPAGRTPKATPRPVAPGGSTLTTTSSTTPRATPKRPGARAPSVPPSSLKRGREDEGNAEQTDKDIHRDKRRRSSIVTPSSQSNSEATGEDTMSIEESNEISERMPVNEQREDEQSPSQEKHASVEAERNEERHLTPEPMEDRPLPSYTPIRRGTEGRGTPRRTPRRSLGPPRRSITIEQDLEVMERRPYSEAEPVDLMTHLPSQPGVEVQNVPLSAFLEMVGISWQDDLIGRKSLAARTDSLKSQFPKGHDFPLPEYVVANLESIYLSMLSWADSEITQRTQQGREILTTIDRVCSENNPPVVHDYLAADEEDRGMFESVLLQIKSVTYLRARARWYDWKQSILSEKVEPDVRGIRDDMLADAERHAAERQTIDRVLPSLRKRRDELEAELAAHRAQVEAVLACDPEEIAALREGIEEQDTELDRFRIELSGKNERNAEVEQELAALMSQGDQHTLAINAARSMCDQATVGDVMRLDAELEALQALHGWKVLRAGPRVEMLLGELELAVPVDALERATLSHKSPRGPDAGLLALAQAALVASKCTSLRDVVDTTTQLWGAARSARDELRRLALYFPVSYEVGHDTLLVSATLVLPKAQARAALNLTLGPDALTSWPEAARALPVAVKLAYGHVDAIGLRERAKETLLSADLSLAGVLFQACAEAAALYA
ncbi:hypothetical protein CC85DRAFT_281965 [Cutaneotrichosporon oleaginosum]|uniref:Spc7 kinetochore protein domain-containing protein n=1 Tax=Cutaneotrichosporon oleaginosum TaxID=879819 RepID=A0A0J0XXP2_9TREE|nr:uncharacterized protein CC85DRAFT_281965 [Cutaneotrichosporon oleaginosum]KLT45808.1 hypothetical protein CC85DRAFT_281965 [Cutaneotrichosporon oleaginosum]TXT06515.1 hypothetical protein COLE_05846 [Cutaneotrichosporon oleaginosum]